MAVAMLPPPMKAMEVLIGAAQDGGDWGTSTVDRHAPAD
jgi:hypothetical protein